MYIPVVGLEIHLQVKTLSKMFCRCSTNYFNKEPNINICPVCFGLPGALPVPNKLAFEKTIKLALALNCNINKETKFDRKNYFYPDLPKGYQISQYDQPIGFDGFTEIEVEGDSRRIRIQRVHLEEDTAKSIHSEEGENEETLIDCNKSGIALIEIVTHPDFQNVDEVLAFAKRLRQIVRYLNVSDAEMQKGQMRFELNISLRSDEKSSKNLISMTNLEKTLGFKLPEYKVEVKNIGSISVLEKVIKFEIQRQGEILIKNEKILNQTRGLKAMTGETLFQRSKENAEDYRYFPEPDIPPLHISEELIEQIKREIPELPAQRKQRYISLGLEGEQADIFVEDFQKGEWFDVCISQFRSIDKKSPFEKEFAKWIIGDISGNLDRKKISIIDSPLKQKDLIDIVTLVRENKISGTIAKEVISEIFEKNDNLVVTDQTMSKALHIITTKNLMQILDSSEIEAFIKEAIDTNSKVVNDLEKNPNAIKFLVGQVMKLSKGKVNPRVAEEELIKILKK